MNKIAILPPGVAERIAAGEVIERPSSVVKELIENSIDAGATQISVHLEEGGKKLIEVLDNGHGMTAADLVLSVKRHATSKLRTLDDLDKIHTLGFRGEALPSVAAVSELSVLSRPQQSPTTNPSDDCFSLTVNSALTFDDVVEKVTFGHFLGSHHGTRIQARGLFSQIPARLKFLKSPGSEVAAVRDWIERLALTHPQIAFKLTSDQRTVLNFPKQTTEDRIRHLIADGGDYPILSATAHAPYLSLTVHWVQGMSVPHSKKIIQIINHRAIKDRLIQQAVLSPFRQALLPGQFPALLLEITCDPARLDVNAHPTKTEVRFLEAGKVFHATQKLIEELIRKNGASGFVRDEFTSAISTNQQGNYEAHHQTTPQTSHNGWGATSTPHFTLASPVQTSFIAGQPLIKERHPFASARYVGVCLNTYILLELDHELILIDQHAADERIRFEKVRNRKSPVSQLLIPEAISLEFLDEQEIHQIRERLPLLASAGFDAEIFGENALLFRGIPSVWGTQNLKTRLRNLIERMNAGTKTEQELLTDEVLFERLASEACRSSVRSGDTLSEWQAQSLVDQLFECEHPWNCPHGRPTTVRLPAGRFEDWFQRRAPHSTDSPDLR